MLRSRGPMSVKLHQYLEDAARRWPDSIAVQEADGNFITYRELDRLSDRMRDRLVELGARPGDHVGFWIRKSIDAVATIFGILKAGAAYVPVDPTAPPTRNNYILADCAVAVIVIESRFRSMLAAELSAQGAYPAILVIDGAGGGGHLRAMLDEEDRRVDAPPTISATVRPDDLAFILYTSGSTGRPKGVQLTHLNAVSFVEWCAQTFALMPTDRFSSHAPFHFDLSVFDIFSAVKHGGALVLIGEEAGKKPIELAQLIADLEITIWYSAPSILSLMAQFGDLDSRNYSSLRFVLFAGEVFPIAHLRSLVRRWPHPRYFNLYGPTETNVCTFYEVPTPIPEDRTEPMPIGKICSHLEGILIDGEGKEVEKGTEGELCIRGSGVTRGYWNLPEQSRKCFVEVAGGTYYRTGDIVREGSGGNLRYLGRKDRMIKKRGFRVELGEIEVCLYRHPDVREAAVVALMDDALGMKVHAHVASKEGARLSLIEMKTFCSEHIPVYMIPDQFSFHPSLPKTSTDKVDYQTLKLWSGG
jgi:amino acid adenylation domain-containing protein